MIPENAGGRAAQTTSILRLSGSILNMIPAMSMSRGITISLRTEPITAWPLMLILTDERVIPATNTAIEELEDIINQRTFDWVRAIRVTEILRSALLEAEELYISAEEDPSPKLIVLDPQSREKKAGP